MRLMVLARAWRRRMYVSLGMAVIVPLALLAALAMLALNGGIPGLGALRQAVAGPSATAVAPPTLGGPVTRSRNAALLGSLPGALVRGAVPPATVGGSGGGSAGALPGSGGGGGAPTGSHGGSSGGGGSGGGGSGGYPGSSRPAAGQPSSPTVVDRVVRSVTPVTSGLPAPVGPAVTKTLKSGGAVADRILHHLPGQ